VPLTSPAFHSNHNQETLDNGGANVQLATPLPFYTADKRFAGRAPS